MKSFAVLPLLVLGFALLCCTHQTFASDEVAEIPEDIALDDAELDEDYALLRQLEEEHMKKDLHRENSLASQIASDIAAELTVKLPFQVDPCAHIHCGAGRVCQSDALTNEATCVCVPSCPPQSDPRRLVCTNHNETWNSDCDVYRQRCLCDMADAGCRGAAFKHLHIDYYGACRTQPECGADEMADFPRRMREWLYAVMRDLAQRDELSEHYKQTLLESGGGGGGGEAAASANLTRGWANAAVWKWCDLDGHPHDRSVSRHELFPIRAPLMSLEHCIAPFLESCDPNGDHRVTLAEWGACLEVDEADMREQCDELSRETAQMRSVGGGGGGGGASASVASVASQSEGD